MGGPHEIVLWTMIRSIHQKQHPSNSAYRFMTRQNFHHHRRIYCLLALSGRGGAEEPLFSSRMGHVARVNSQKHQFSPSGPMRLLQRSTRRMAVRRRSIADTVRSP